MTHAASPLFPAVLLLAVGLIGLTASHYFKFSPIIGLFISGAVIGPHGLRLLEGDSESLHILAELGVCFLLFDIGLHFSLAELKTHWKKFLAIGLLQFVLVTVGLAAAAFVFGLPWKTALPLGAIFSLSSTALVLKILGEDRELTSPTGRVVTELLVFQDLVAILLLVTMSGSHAEGPSFADLLQPLGTMLIAAPVMVLVGRFALNPLFQGLIAMKYDEAFTALALLIVLLTSLITESLGLSLALGAFLGGLTLSESSYAYLVKAEVSPFRGLLLSLFFITVGMSFDIGHVVAEWAAVLVGLALLLVIKSAATFLALKITGMPRESSVRTAILLSQGSEFAFVLLAAATQAALMTEGLASTAVAVVSVSLALTPLLAKVSCRLSRESCHIENSHSAAAQKNCEVVIVEFDDFGRNLAGLLIEAGVPYRGHDRDYARLTYAKSRGFNVYFSDTERPRTISLASIGGVPVVVSLVEDDQVIEYLVTGLRKVAPTVALLGASWEPRRLEVLVSVGVPDPYLKSDTSAYLVFAEILRALGWDEPKIDDAVTRARQRMQLDTSFPRAAASVDETQATAA